MAAIAAELSMKALTNFMFLVTISWFGISEGSVQLCNYHQTIALTSLSVLF